MVPIQLLLMPTVALRYPVYLDYWGAMGVSWLDKGGVYVLANIRGGGEI